MLLAAFEFDSNVLDDHFQWHVELHGVSEKDGHGEHDSDRLIEPKQEPLLVIRPWGHGLLDLRFVLRHVQGNARGYLVTEAYITEESDGRV